VELARGPYFTAHRVEGTPDPALMAEYAGPMLVIPRRGEVELGEDVIFPGECVVAADVSAGDFWPRQPEHPCSRCSLSVILEPPGMIAQTIQLALAPVFVLVAIGNIMNILTNRLAAWLIARATCRCSMPVPKAANTIPSSSKCAMSISGSPISDAPFCCWC